MASAHNTDSDRSMDEEDYLQVIVESEGRQGYLYEPVYTEAQLQCRDEEEAAAAAAAATATAGTVGEEQRLGHTSWCSCTKCIAMDTEEESFCCHEFPRAQFIIDELLNARGGQPTGRPRPENLFQDPQKELGRPTRRGQMATCCLSK